MILYIPGWIELSIQDNSDVAYMLSLRNANAVDFSI